MCNKNVQDTSKVGVFGWCHNSQKIHEQTSKEHLITKRVPDKKTRTDYCNGQVYRGRYEPYGT